jgi:hypothetical protein
MISEDKINKNQVENSNNTVLGKKFRALGGKGQSIAICSCKSSSK